MNLHFAGVIVFNLAVEFEGDELGVDANEMLQNHKHGKPSSEKIVFILVCAVMNRINPY